MAQKEGACDFAFLAADPGGEILPGFFLARILPPELG